MVNDRSGGNSQFQINENSRVNFNLGRSAQSSQFMVNDRSNASSAFNIKEQSISSINFQIGGTMNLNTVKSKDFEISQSHFPVSASTGTSNAKPNAYDDRKITASGSYNINQHLQQMQLGNDSDNYSEDFYSDGEFEEPDPAFQQTIQKQTLNKVVDIYQKYLNPDEQDFKLSESFKK